MKFLFWNIEKKQVCFDVIADLVKDEALDVIALAEFPKDKNGILLQKLQVVNPDFSLLKPLVNEKVVVYYCKSTAIVNNQFNEGKVAIKRITSKNKTPIAYIAFLHLASKVNYSDDELAERMKPIIGSVQHFEEKSEYEQGLVLLCGDLNMNPFERGIIQASGLNAVMESDIAKKGSRTIDGIDYKFFYNPMWGFLGDLGKGTVSGTYYFNSTHHIQYFWNLYDQVLMRPEAISYFDKDALKIVTNSSNFNLLKKSGLIDDKNYSDHLPITFTLNI